MSACRHRVRMGVHVTMVTIAIHVTVDQVLPDSSVKRVGV